MNKKDEKHMKLLADLHQDSIVTMQAALIEWKHGNGAEAALQWIVNTLCGPGLLPDPDAPYGKDAQRFMSLNRSDPFPKCSCEKPSHILWSGKGFCSEECRNVALAKSRH